MTATIASPRSTHKPERSSFGSLIRAEWTKFRTVRGWMIGLFVATVLCVGFTFVVANGNHQGSCTVNGVCTAGHPFVPTGPNGQAVADSYEFVDQPLTGDGTLTARVASLTGLIGNGPANIAPSLAHTEPGLDAWAKAGILLTPSTTQGSPYAAVMATGSHGARFQYNYTHDHLGPHGTVVAASPRWLRLTRAGDTITGFESATGTTWTQISAAHLAGLPATVDVGLFVTSPVSFQTSRSGAPTRATAAFDHVTLNNRAVSNAWQGRSIGTSPNDYYPTLAVGDYHRSGTTLVLSGSGDIASAVNPLAGGNTASGSLWFGLVVALLVLIVVATTFITVEYRRGLIRTTFTTIPQRGSVLAAKAVIIGAVAFAVGAIATAVGIPLGLHVLTTGGNYIFPASTLTKLRIIAGSGALLALTAVAVLALGTILRTSAGAVTTGIAVFVLPYLVSTYSSSGVGTWLFRLTPAAAFSILGVIPRSAVVDAPYTMSNDYYPLAPWAGLLVLCAYTAVAFAVATLAPPAGRMTEAIHAEWIKLRTVTGTLLLLAGVIALTTGVSSAIAAATHETSGGGDPTELALSGVAVGQAVVAVFAVLAVTEEYGTGMIRVSLTAVPRRLTLLAAKAVNVAGLTLTVGVIAVAGCLLAGRLLLPGAGFDPAHRYALVSISHGPTLRAAIGSVLYLVLIALLALGVATAIRDTAVSIGAVLALLYLPPLLAQVVSDPLRRHLQQIAPMSAGLAIQTTTDISRLPITPWAGIAVLAAWAAASLLGGALLLWLRDA